MYLGRRKRRKGGIMCVYVDVTDEKDNIIKRHKTYMKRYLNQTDTTETLPFLYWLPKLHKSPTKQRYIAAYDCTTKYLSKTLSKCLKLIEKQHLSMARSYSKYWGLNPMWILPNSSKVHDIIENLNRKKECRNIKTYDFTTLYTSIPHRHLKRELGWVVTEAFKKKECKFISIYRRMRSGQILLRRILSISTFVK